MHTGILRTVLRHSKCMLLGWTGSCEATAGIIIIIDTLVAPGGLFCPNIIYCMIFVSGLGVECGKYSPYLALTKPSVLSALGLQSCAPCGCLFLKTVLQSRAALREGTESKCHHHMVQPHSRKVDLENKGDGEVIPSIKLRSKWQGWLHRLGLL